MIPAALVLLLTAVPRHDEKVSASKIVVLERELVWEVDVARSWLEERVKFPAASLDLSEAQLQSVKAEIARYLRAGLSAELNGAVAEPEVGALTPEYFPWIATGEPYIARLKMVFRFRAAGEIRRIKLGVRFFEDQTKKHQAIVAVIWNGAIYEFAPIGPTGIELPPPSGASRLGRTVWDFLRWGMHHIFIGYDHIAFLLALLLAARRMMEMVKIATSFTVAHSLTLLFSALDVIRLNSRVTESLIAASIVYVAVENYTLKEGKYRWILTFAFGLVHGLGFSSVLKERLSEASGVLVPVLSFNVGVELGQIAILLVAFPLAQWVRRGKETGESERRHRRLLVWGSAVILLLGLTWLVERLFDVKFLSRWLE
jgi:hydrogenase/urease accessory protein HupE